jgi:hypothetical protein
MQIRVRAVHLALATGTIIIALVVGAQAQAPTGLAGTWTLDVAKSKFSPGPAPKSMTITYAAEGADGLKITVDIAPAEGAAQHWEMTAHSDGKDYPMTGNPTADSISMRKIDDHTGETTFKKTLTITSKGTTAEGKPRHDVEVFTKS